MVAFDAPDAASAARFWERRMRWPVVDECSAEDRVTIRDDRGLAIAFQRAPDLQRPTWPDPPTPEQAHLDLSVQDLASTTAPAELGATELDRSSPSCQILADPAGHPFCICPDPGADRDEARRPRQARSATRACDFHRSLRRTGARGDRVPLRNMMGA